MPLAEARLRAMSRTRNRETRGFAKGVGFAMAMFALTLAFVWGLVHAVLDTEGARLPLNVEKRACSE